MDLTPDEFGSLAASFLLVLAAVLVLLFVVPGVALARLLDRRCDCLVFDAGGSFGGGASFLVGVACASCVPSPKNSSAMSSYSRIRNRDKVRPNCTQKI